LSSVFLKNLFAAISVEKYNSAGQPQVRPEAVSQKVKGPELGTRGLHSEGLAVGGDSPPGMLSVLI
jgi:hypothetical protein